jgi:hypothetical protein
MENTPANEEQWANEAVEAMKMALKLLEEDLQGPPDEAHKEELHKYAPILAAYNRDVQDKSQVVEMVQYALSRQHEKAATEGATHSGEINFIAAYLDAHIAIDLLDADGAERIMQYIAAD